MTVLFPKWTNKLPAVLALGAAAVGLTVVFVVWFWFSPRHLEVGYQPEQPILYSHKLHAGLLGMDCRYCHREVERGPHATLPDADTCYGCHRHVQNQSERLQLLRDNYGDGTGDNLPLQWVKVHLLPQYAYFDHRVHIHAGVGCASCHGRIDQMEVVRQVEPLSMGWCLECHRAPESHLRPAGTAPTLMDWQPSDDSIKAARARLAAGELNPPTHCSACHR